MPIIESIKKKFRLNIHYMYIIPILLDCILLYTIITRYKKIKKISYNEKVSLSKINEVSQSGYDGAYTVIALILTTFYATYTIGSIANIKKDAKGSEVIHLIIKVIIAIYICIYNNYNFNTLNRKLAFLMNINAEKHTKITKRLRTNIILSVIAILLYIIGFITYE